MSIRSRNKVEVSFSMSSMTDIVFLLLIFFIILSTLVSPFGVKVDLPTGKSRTTEHPKIDVSITSDLQYSLNGSYLTKSELREGLRGYRGGTEKVVLHVDKTIPTGETIEILSMAKEFGLEIVIATTPK
ncbi:MAG: biopolymer transporter ExbD [Salibacteraceae bacterium]|jgi:biopolymer transport protein ExbD|nr:biopolymer transporter ExbD [Salibacteraceae bacterium]MDP4934125.1 biopolymer transporter ExbD [Salibacteraceae bacterium]